MSVSTSVPPALLVGLRVASKMLSVSERTAWQLAKDGRLPCIRLGRRLLFSVSALETWIAQATSTSEA